MAARLGPLEATYLRRAALLNGRGYVASVPVVIGRLAAHAATWLGVLRIEPLRVSPLRA